MRRTEAWWVCRCGVKVARVRDSLREKHIEHAKACPNPGYCIQQVEQRQEHRRGA